MIQSVRLGNITSINPFNLTQRIRTFNNESHHKQKQYQQLSSKFRVSGRQTFRSGIKIKSEGKSPDIRHNMERRSTTYRKFTQKQSNIKLLHQRDNYLIQLNSNQNQIKGRYKIRTNGILPDFQGSSSQKKKQKKTLSGKKVNQSSKIHKSKDKFNFTPLEMEELKKYHLYYRGTRAIALRSQFTNQDGNPIIKKGDSVAFRYQIVQEIGKGAFGKVFKVIDHKKKQQAALKIIRNIPKLTEQSKVEVDILEKILQSDPQGRYNIVKIKNSFTFRGHPCITYELLKMNLYEYLKNNKFVPPLETTIVKFAVQILYSLLLMEKQSIVHCDIKPENIMLKDEKKTGIKIIDMGSGCFEKKQIYTYIQSRFYRAPEIILGIKYTTAIDIWSFGCVIAELWTGYPLFPGQTEDQQILMFIQLLGNPPKTMLEIASRRKKFFKDNFQCRIIQSTDNVKLPKNLSFQKALGAKNNKNLISFIKGCLEWDPQKRLTPKQALLHEWILSNIPNDLRIKHVIQVTGEAYPQKGFSQPGYK